MAEYKVGDIVGNRYKLLLVLGEGGMGKVYKALDTKLDQDVAFKTIKPGIGGSTIVRRMIREAKSLAKFRSNPNILTIYDFYEDDQVVGLITEYIDGSTLSALMKLTPRLYPPILLLIIREICEALEEPHAAGFIHRDLKPANIMIEKNGRIVLMDFGLIKQLGGSKEEVTQVSNSSDLLGTPGYVSPEVVTQQEIGPYSDIFAIGIMLYEIVVGYNPFRHQTRTIYEILSNIVEGRVVPPSKFLPNMDPALDKLIIRALHPQVEHRHQQVSRVKNILDTYLAKYHLPHPKEELRMLMADPEGYRHALAGRFMETSREMLQAGQAEDALRILTDIYRFNPAGRRDIKEGLPPNLYNQLRTSIPDENTLAHQVSLLTRVQSRGFGRPDLDGHGDIAGRPTTTRSSTSSLKSRPNDDEPSDEVDDGFPEEEKTFQSPFPRGKPAIVPEESSAEDDFDSRGQTIEAIVDEEDGTDGRGRTMERPPNRRIWRTIGLGGLIVVFIVTVLMTELGRRKSEKAEVLARISQINDAAGVMEPVKVKAALPSLPVMSIEATSNDTCRIANRGGDCHHLILSWGQNSLVYAPHQFKPSEAISLNVSFTPSAENALAGTIQISQQVDHLQYIAAGGKKQALRGNGIQEKINGDPRQLTFITPGGEKFLLKLHITEE
jgi:serine/threonine-protein kinase